MWKKLKMYNSVSYVDCVGFHAVHVKLVIAHTQREDSLVDANSYRKEHV